jgi:ATP-binding cassette, subfamily C (CFTR/MRP), member 1
VFATFISTLALYIGTLEAARFTHNYLLSRVLHAPMSFFDQTPIGRIINRFSKDIEAVDSDLPATLRAFSACLFGVKIYARFELVLGKIRLRRWREARSVNAFDV